MAKLSIDNARARQALVGFGRVLEGDGGGVPQLLAHQLGLEGSLKQCPTGPHRR
jgi:hypothetical protein